MNRHFSMRLLVWTLGATLALVLAWCSFAVVGPIAVATLYDAAATMAGALIVVFASVAAIVSGSFAPGRSLIMWHQARKSPRQSSS